MWDPKLSGQNVSVLEGGDHKKEFEINQGQDSGFLSGPQTYSSSDIAIDVDDEIASKHIASQQQQQQFHQSFTDSGLIDDIGNSSEHISDKDAKAPTSNNMILDSRLDSGLSEWFCNLNLENSAQPMNNLGTSKKEQKAQKDLQSQLWKLYYQQDDEGDTQLHVAIMLQMEMYVIWEIIKMAPAPWLLELKNEISAAPIHFAVEGGHSNVVRRLLMAGAKASTRNKDGNTALHIACQTGDINSVQALTLPIAIQEVQEAYRNSERVPEMHTCTKLPCPITLEERNFDGERAVHIAAMKNHIHILRHLVYVGADINAGENRAGYTPLHIAVYYNHIEMVAFLLKECRQINVEALTWGRLTAYQFAASQGNRQEIMSLLEQFGCQRLSPPPSDYSDDSDDSEDSYDL